MTENIPKQIPVYSFNPVEKDFTKINESAALAKASSTDSNLITDRIKDQEYNINDDVVIAENTMNINRVPTQSTSIENTQYNNLLNIEENKINEDVKFSENEIQASAANQDNNPAQEAYKMQEASRVYSQIGAIQKSFANFQ